MKTREEILKLWEDQEICPDFLPILEELLNDRETLQTRLQEAVGDIGNVLSVRERLRSKSVSMRAFLIMDKVFNPIKNKYGIKFN